MKSKRKKTDEQGFTLIEVLVALGILVFSMLALMQSLSTASQHTLMLDEHTQGYLLASNKLVELQVHQEWPNTGTQVETVEINDQSWRIRTKIVEGPYPGTRRVDIEVGPVRTNVGEWTPVYQTLTMLGAPPSIVPNQTNPQVSDES